MALSIDPSRLLATLKTVSAQANTRPTWRSVLEWIRHPDRFVTSIRSQWSIRSILSFASLGSVGSACSAGSAFSAFSAGSILSWGSAGSILSINSVGSILSINSCGKILSRKGRSAIENETTQQPADAPVRLTRP